MGWLEKITIGVGLLHVGKIPACCQYCGTDVTKTGAHVSEGIVYCQDTDCIRKHVENEGLNDSVFYTSKKLQKAIREGELVNYRDIKNE